MINIAIKDYLIFLKQLIDGTRTAAELGSIKTKESDLALTFSKHPPLTILDLANGRLRPQSTILSSLGHKVIGLDIINYDKTFIIKNLYRLARFLFSLHLPHKKTNIKPIYTTGDAGKLPFKSNSFDLITSNAAFEHFLDIPSVVKECARVLKPNGRAWIGIHVFTTISGGHNTGMRLEATNQLPKGIEPWDHLRKRKLPFTVPLNEWRIDHYRKEFEKNFKILKAYRGGSEGLELLTPEIKAELKDYTEEELTCGGYIFVLEKE